MLVYTQRPSKFSWASYKNDKVPSSKNINFYLDSKGVYNPLKSEKRRNELKEQRERQMKLPTVYEIIQEMATVFGNSRANLIFK